MSYRLKKLKYSIKKYLNFDEKHFVSFPKSGRTWVRMFLSHYYFSCYPLSITARNRLFYDSKIPNMVFSHGAHNDYGESCLKDIKKESYRLRNKQKILLLRDPRDVIISYYFQITKRIPESASKNKINTISDIIEHKNLGFKRIIEFMNCWHKYSREKNSIVVFYEELRKHPEKEFSKILKHLGETDINEKALFKSIEETSFEKMKKKEKEKISQSKYLNAANPKDKNSYKSRKGKIKGFYDYLSEKEVQKLNTQMLGLSSELKLFYLDN